MQSFLRRAGALTLLLGLACAFPARAALPPPIDHLSWLLGTWSCNTPGGSPLSYKQTYAQAGNGIAQTYTLLGSPFSGSVGYDGKQFVYTSSAKVKDSTVTQHMTAPPDKVTDHSFEFTGTVAARGTTEKERWAGSVTGANTYTDRAFAFVNGSWQQILEVACKRV